MCDNQIIFPRRKKLYRLVEGKKGKCAAVIDITGPIGTTLYEHVLNALIELSGNYSMMMDKIVIMLNSPGGEVENSFAIYDLIKSYTKLPLYIVGTGSIMSGGTIILQGAKKGHRVSFPNSTFMVHFGSLSIGEGDMSKEDLENIFNYEKYSNTRLRDFYVKALDSTTRKVNALLKRDSYITAEEAIKLGLIDRIITNLGEI